MAARIETLKYNHFAICPSIRLGEGRAGSLSPRTMETQSIRPLAMQTRLPQLGF